MKNKNLINKKNTIRMLFVIAIIILTMISLQGTFAADQTITNTTTGGISQGINDINSGDTLYLQPGTYSGSNNTRIFINKNATIRGNGSTNSVIIDAKLNGSIFSSSGNITLRFLNITFTNGNVTSGGVISSSGGSSSASKMTFINCIFTNNIGGDGSAIIFNREKDPNYNLTVDNCSFYNNGIGSISNRLSDNLVVTNCNFINNNGTAINNENSDNAFVSNCTFINNSGYWGGGYL